MKKIKSNIRFLTMENLNSVSSGFVGGFSFGMHFYCKAKFDCAFSEFGVKVVTPDFRDRVNQVVADTKSMLTNGVEPETYIDISTGSDEYRTIIPAYDAKHLHRRLRTTHSRTHGRVLYDAFTLLALLHYHRISSPEISEMIVLLEPLFTEYLVAYEV